SAGVPLLPRSIYEPDWQIRNIIISRGISDGRGLEEGTHLGGTALQAAHVGGQTGLERRLVPWRATARHRLLEVIIEEFVRIVLGREEPAPAKAGDGR